MDICIVRIYLDYFETFSKDEICAIHEAVVQESDELWLLNVYWQVKMIFMLNLIIQTVTVRMYWTTL